MLSLQGTFKATNNETFAKITSMEQSSQTEEM